MIDTIEKPAALPLTEPKPMHLIPVKTDAAPAISQDISSSVNTIHIHTERISAI